MDQYIKILHLFMVKFKRIAYKIIIINIFIYNRYII